MTLQIQKADDLLPAKKPYHGNLKGRLKGCKDKKPRKTARRPLAKFTPDEILDYKLKILKFLETGEARTLTECASLLDIPALRVHQWSKDDKDFQSMIGLAQEVQADKIEAEFMGHANFIPKMMLLKAWRPMYRDNFKVDMTNSKLEQMLEELKRVGEKQLKET